MSRLVTAKKPVAFTRLGVSLVGQVFLFNNSILKLKEFLQFGDLGKIYSFASTQTKLGPIRQNVKALCQLPRL